MWPCLGDIQLRVPPGQDTESPAVCGPLARAAGKTQGCLSIKRISDRFYILRLICCQPNGSPSSTGSSGGPSYTGGQRVHSGPHGPWLHTWL
jgi:hypothetical protein